MGWNHDTTGLDALGFGVLPAGIYPYTPDYNIHFEIFNLDFIGLYNALIGLCSCFWSTTQYGDEWSLDVNQYYTDANAFCVSYDNELIFSDLASKALGLSVRCVMDSVARN